jgi:hypothetical protein
MLGTTPAKPLAAMEAHRKDHQVYAARCKAMVKSLACELPMGILLARLVSWVLIGLRSLMPLVSGKSLVQNSWQGKTKELGSKIS